MEKETITEIVEKIVQERIVTQLEEELQAVRAAHQPQPVEVKSGLLQTFGRGLWDRGLPNFFKWLGQPVPILTVLVTFFGVWLTSLHQQRQTQNERLAILKTFLPEIAPESVPPKLRFDQSDTSNREAPLGNHDPYDSVRPLTLPQADWERERRYAAFVALAESGDEDTVLKMALQFPTEGLDAVVTLRDSDERDSNKECGGDTLADKVLRQVLHREQVSQQILKMRVDAMFEAIQTLSPEDLLQEREESTDTREDFNLIGIFLSKQLYKESLRALKVEQKAEESAASPEDFQKYLKRYPHRVITALAEYVRNTQDWQDASARLNNTWPLETSSDGMQSWNEFIEKAKKELSEHEQSLKIASESPSAESSRQAAIKAKDYLMQLNQEADENGQSYAKALIAAAVEHAEGLQQNGEASASDVAAAKSFLQLTRILQTYVERNDRVGAIGAILSAAILPQRKDQRDLIVFLTRRSDALISDALEHEPWLTAEHKVLLKIAEEKLEAARTQIAEPTPTNNSEKDKQANAKAMEAIPEVIANLKYLNAQATQFAENERCEWLGAIEKFETFHDLADECCPNRTDLSTAFNELIHALSTKRSDESWRLINVCTAIYRARLNLMGECDDTAEESDDTAKE